MGQAFLLPRETLSLEQSDDWASSVAFPIARMLAAICSMWQVLRPRVLLAQLPTPWQ